tara:strand:- start:6370 stop:7653 length:1284 start_codon:yes stop_codon:yes gene_type:complete
MIEIINIIFFVFFVVFLISFGKNNILFNNKKLIKNDINEYSVFNLLFTLNIIWVSSILDLNKHIVVSLILVILIINLLKNILGRSEVNIKNNLEFLVLMVTIISLSIIIAHDLFFSHDVRLYWFEKAILFYNDLFIDKDLTIKPEYPHFGTYLWGFFWKFSFLNLEYFGRIPYIIIYVFSIFYILNKINFKSIFIKYILFFFLILLTFKIKWFDGRQDILVFAFNTFIFGFMYELISNNSKKKIHIIGFILSLNLLLWTKNESYLYLITYLLLTTIYIKDKEKFILIFGIISIFLVKLVFTKIYELSYNPNLDTFETDIFQHIKSLDFIYRFTQVLIWYLVGLLRNPVLLLSLIFFLILLKNSNIYKEYSYFVLAYITISLGIFSVYFVTKYDFPFHMVGSVGRVFLQFSMIFFIPIFKFCEKKKLV